MGEILALLILILALPLGWWGTILYALLRKSKPPHQGYSAAKIALFASGTAIAIAWTAGPFSVGIIALFPPVILIPVWQVLNGFENLPGLGAHFWLGFLTAFTVLGATLFALRKHLGQTKQLLILTGGIFLCAHIGLLTANRHYQDFLIQKAEEANATCVNISTLHGILPVSYGLGKTGLHVFIVADGQYQYWSFRKQAFVSESFGYRQPSTADACQNSHLTHTTLRAFSKY